MSDFLSSAESAIFQFDEFLGFPNAKPYFPLFENGDGDANNGRYQFANFIGAAEQILFDNKHNKKKPPPRPAPAKGFALAHQCRTK